MVREEDRVESENEEGDFADAEITNICLCEKDREGAKEKVIRLLTDELQTPELFCHGRASARNLITSKQLAEAALRYLREKYNFTDEEIEELKEEAARRYYQWYLRYPFVIQKKGYRIYFPDEDSFRDYLRHELGRQQQQYQSQQRQHQQQQPQPQRRQQQQHNTQEQATLAEFEPSPSSGSSSSSSDAPSSSSESSEEASSEEGASEEEARELIKRARSILEGY